MAKVHVFLQNDDISSLSGYSTNSDIYIYGTKRNDSMEINEQYHVIVTDAMGNDTFIIKENYSSSLVSNTGNILTIRDSLNTKDILKIQGIGVGDVLYFNNGVKTITGISASSFTVTDNALPSLSALTTGSATELDSYINSNEKTSAGLKLKVDLTSVSNSGGSDNILVYMGGTQVASDTITNITNNGYILVPTTISWGTDGTKTFYAKVSSTNIASPSVDFILDSTAPNKPTLDRYFSTATSSVSTINDSTINASEATKIVLTGTGEVGDTISISIDDANNSPATTAIITTTSVSADGTWTTSPASTLNLSTLNDGNIIATVTQTDLAGNTSSSTTQTYVKDTSTVSSISAFTISGDHAIATFNDTINYINLSSNLSHFTINANSISQPISNAYISNNQILFTLTNKIDNDDTITISYDGLVSSLTDSSGNTVGAISATTATANTTSANLFTASGTLSSFSFSENGLSIANVGDVFSANDMLDLSTLGIVTSAKPASGNLDTANSGSSPIIYYDTTNHQIVYDSDGTGATAGTTIATLNSAIANIPSANVFLQAKSATPTGLDLATASDSGNSTSDNITNISSVSISGNSVANSSIKIYKNGVDTGTTATADGSGVWTATVALTANATNIITATATDAGKSESNQSNSLPIVVDTTAPTVTSVTATESAGAYKTGTTLHLNVNMSETVLVTGTDSTLGLNTTPSANALFNTVSNNIISFNYAIGASDNSSSLDTTTITLNTSTIKDIAGNSATLTIPGSNNLADNVAIDVDNSAPAVTVTSAEFYERDDVNSLNNIIKLNGTGFSSLLQSSDGGSSSVDIKSRLDFTSNKFGWDKDSDGTADFNLAVGDIAQINVISNTRLDIELSSASSVFSSNTNLANDKLLIDTAFFKDKAGNAQSSSNVNPAVTFMDYVAKIPTSTTSVSPFSPTAYSQNLKFKPFDTSAGTFYISGANFQANSTNVNLDGFSSSQPINLSSLTKISSGGGVNNQSSGKMYLDLASVTSSLITTGSSDSEIKLSSGQNTLNSGAGINTYILNALPSNSANVDLIQDFGFDTDGDILQLKTSVFSAIGSTVDSNEFVMSVTAPTLSTTRLFIDDSPTNAELYYDPTGTGTSGDSVKLLAVTSSGNMPVYDDFVIIA